MGIKSKSDFRSASKRKGQDHGCQNSLPTTPTNIVLRCTMRLNFRLKDIHTRTELAEKLRVDIKALDLVTLTKSSCTNNGCSLPAVLNNSNRCVLCSQSWYPRLKNEKDEDMKYCRGHGLFGAQFMRLYGERKSAPPTCCCTSLLCEKIGYSHEGMLRLPTDAADCKEATRVLGILDSQKRDKIVKNSRAYRVAPWHYHERHLMRGDNGKWIFRDMPKYKDTDGKSFPFPPPNANVQHYIDHKIPSFEYARGGYDDTLPLWVKDVSKVQAATVAAAAGPTSNVQAATKAAVAGVPTSSSRTTTPSSANKVRKVATPSPQKRTPRKRSSPEAIALEEREEQVRDLQAKLNSALEHIEGLRATVELQGQELIQIRLERDNLLDQNKELKSKIEMLEQKKCVITYDMLRSGGQLHKYVNDFTFFPDVECNDAFLDMINYTEGCEEGNGLCENLVRYSKVSMEERKKWNDSLQANKDIEQSDDGNEPESNGENDDDDAMSISSDAATGMMDIAEEAMDAEENADATASPTRNKSRRKLSWKTEYLVYCFYAKCNISMRRVAGLFGIGPTLVHNIVYAWANVLCRTLEKFFPTPTRSQMLRAYPISHIKYLGHAKTFMLLDATEGYAEVASMKTVNAILYSAYKHNSTIKWLVGSDPIGTTWDESITEGYPGSISDNMQTTVTSILEQIPFGCAVEVDKGFLIENDCALLGIITVRPMKMLEKQQQQSKEDAALTQKVGKTRIAIEQANGQTKRGVRFFDRKIRIDQIGLADLIFRASYLLQNYKLGFIQGRSETAEAFDRPCKAEIRWHNGMDEGLVDIRAEVDMWGNETEVRRWFELRQLPSNQHLSNTDISELVLAEDWPTRLRKEHIARFEAGDI